MGEGREETRGAVRSRVGGNDGGLLSSVVSTGVRHDVPAAINGGNIN